MCDERCWDADSKGCDCDCMGRNHGTHRDPGASGSSKISALMKPKNISGPITYLTDMYRASEMTRAENYLDELRSSGYSEGQINEIRAVATENFERTHGDTVRSYVDYFKTPGVERRETSSGALQVEADENATHAWANRPNQRWPGSTISEHKVFAAWDRHGDLVDFEIDGGKSDASDFDGNEINAFLDDLRGQRKDKQNNSGHIRRY